MRPASYRGALHFSVDGLTGGYSLTSCALVLVGHVDVKFEVRLHEKLDENQLKKCE